MITRRRVLAGWAALAATTALAQRVGLPRIALVDPDRTLEGLYAATEAPGPVDLSFSPGSPGEWPVFFAELRRLGYIEGENVLIERWSAYGIVDRPGRTAIIREIAASAPDIIVTRAPAWTALMKEAITDIPILTYASYPFEFGLVANPSRPEGNVTGFGGSGLEVIGKRAQLLTELAPGVRRVACSLGRRFLEVDELARGLAALTEDLARAHIVFLPVPYEPPLSVALKDFDQWLNDTIARLIQQGAQGVVDLGDANIDQEGLARGYKEAGLPNAGSGTLARLGGLIGYSAVSSDDGYAGLARYADRILRGAKVVDLPLQTPTEFSFVINARTAASLGLSIPEHLRLLATEIIE